MPTAKYILEARGKTLDPVGEVFGFDSLTVARVVKLKGNGRLVLDILDAQTFFRPSELAPTTVDTKLFRVVIDPGDETVVFR